MDQPIYEQIDLDLLKLDSYNPRLPKSLHGKSEEDILEYMLLDASLIELMLAIGENGFFPGEQLLVVKDETDNKYKVIEGNRRLSSVKLLKNPGLAKVQKSKIDKVLEETQERPDKIPCLIFPKEENIHNYLGYRHITGIKEWKLLEKARYLFSMWKSSYADLNVDSAAREIAKVIGSRKDYVTRILVGFEIYRMIEDEKFYRIKDLDDTTFYFNYIADSLNKSNIIAFMGVDFSLENPIENISPTNLKTWTKWLFEKGEQNKTRLLGTSADLTKLNRVVGHTAAKKAFEGGMDLDRSYELTEDLDLIFRESVTKSLDYLERADKIVHRVQEFYPDLEDDLKAIRQLTSKIKTVKDNAEDEKF